MDLNLKLGVVFWAGGNCYMNAGCFLRRLALVALVTALPTF
jgi:hypothetical protein